MEHNCTGVILAGGQNSRMSNKNKAFLPVGGKRIIDRVIDVYRSLFSEILLVTNTPGEYSNLDVSIVSDIHDKKSPLAGLHAGMFYSSNPWVFAVPCDLPFLKKELVEEILNFRRLKSQIVVPETSKGFEPLCAAYSCENISRIETCLYENRLKIRSFYKNKTLSVFSEKRIRDVDPEMLSFFNVNTPEDLEQAEVIAGEHTVCR